MLFEIGFDQAEDIIEIMKENNFKNIKVFNDYSSTPRCVLGKLKTRLKYMKKNNSLKEAEENL